MTRRYWSLVVLSTLLFACQKGLEVRPLTPRKVTVESVTVEQRAEFDAAKSFLESGQNKAAKKAFSDYFTKYPNTELTDDALFNVAQLERKAKNFEEAYDLYFKLIESFPSSKFVDSAKYYYGALGLKLDRVAEAMPIMETLRIDRLPEDSKRTYLKVLRSGYKLSNNLPKWIETDILLLRFEQGNADIRQEVIELIRGVEDQRLLKDILEMSDGDFPTGYVLVRLARLDYKAGEFRDARRRLERFRREFQSASQSHEESQWALTMLDRLERLDQPKPNTIGVLLPLTGNFEIVGRRILKGILLAADLFNQTPGVEPITLIVRDTKNDAEVALEQAENLVLDEQVVALIGPALKNSTEGALTQLQRFGVPTLVLSPDEDVADVGDFIFQNCLRKSDQVRELVRFAVEDLGAKRVAIMYPKHPYGVEMFDILWKELARFPQVQVHGVESYEKDANDYGDQVRRLTGLFYVKPRSHEICKPQQKENCYERKKLPPVVDFEVLFIPDSAEKVRQIAPSLSYYGVKGVQLLGGNLWHNNTLLSKDTSTYLQGATFVDAFDPSSQRPASVSFFSQFKNLYKEEPDILAAQGFDSMTMVKFAANRGRLTDRKSFQYFLQDMPTIEGAAGRTAFKRNGEPNREIFLFTIDGSNFRLQQRDNL